MNYGSGLLMFTATTLTKEGKFKKTWTNTNIGVYFYRS